jgi:hypothetical protein
MKSPLDQFADRIIANHEVEEFIHGLIDKGVDPLDIRGFTQSHQEKPAFINQDMYYDMICPRRYGGHTPGKLP